MTWTSITWSTGEKPVSSTKMQQMQDNITALANGDSGAPEIVDGALAETYWQLWKSGTIADYSSIAVDSSVDKFYRLLVYCIATNGPYLRFNSDSGASQYAWSQLCHGYSGGAVNAHTHSTADSKIPIYRQYCDRYFLDYLFCFNESSHSSVSIKGHSIEAPTYSRFVSYNAMGVYNESSITTINFSGAGGSFDWYLYKVMTK